MQRQSTRIVGITRYLNNNHQIEGDVAVGLSVKLELVPKGQTGASSLGRLGRTPAASQMRMAAGWGFQRSTKGTSLVEDSGPSSAYALLQMLAIKLPSTAVREMLIDSKSIYFPRCMIIVRQRSRQVRSKGTR